MDIFSFIKKYSLTLAFMICSVTSYSQKTPIGAQLKSYYDSFWNQEDYDITPVEAYLNTISEKDVMNESDSTQYFYHYIIGGIYANRGNEDLKIVHAKKAIAIREKSVGILDPEYIELLWGLGSYYEKSNIDLAISYYQKAIVVGQTILNYKTFSSNKTAFMLNTYGIILGDLARIYEKKMWDVRVIQLYETAFQIKSQFYEKGDASCYVDLYNLATYYCNKKEYDKAMEAMQKVVNYLISNGELATNAYIHATYMLASYLSQCGQHKEAEKKYQNAITLARDSLGHMNENLELLYGNYCIELADNASYEELNRVLPLAYDYYYQTSSMSTYIRILLYITNILCNKELYTKASEYNDSLFKYTIYMSSDVKKIFYSQRANIEFGKHNIANAILWKEREVSIAQRIENMDSIGYLGIISQLATLYYQNNNTERASELFKQAIESLHKSNLETHELFEQCVNHIDNLFQFQGETGSEESFLILQKHILEEKKLTDISIYAQICNSLSVLQTFEKKLDDAYKNNVLAENLFVRLYGKQSFQYATALHNKGRILMLFGKNKQALKCLLKSKNIQISINDTFMPNTEKYIQELKR